MYKQKLYTLSCHELIIGYRPFLQINIVENKNIFILELKDVEPAKALANKEVIRQMLQEATGRIILIERIVGRRFVGKDNFLDVDSDGSDVQFVILTDERRLEVNKEFDM